jgi:radical SAM/Cys-rich protein
MVNVGLRCNLACELCHQSSSPERTETMSRGTMLDALHFAADIRPKLIDVTGGEPTLWPHLREFVMLAAEVAPRTRVRTNLEVLLLPELANVAPMLAENRVEILASLPEALECRTIGACIEALHRLAELGYGDPTRAAAAALDLAYNPLPGEMPRAQAEIEAEFRAALAPHGVTFRSLIALTNVPLGGFARWLDEAGEREQYRVGLRNAFNPQVLPNLACRHGIEVAWDGTLWDCDFNLAAGTQMCDEAGHVGEYVGSQVGQIALTTRRISFAEHCFACSAGAGSG